MKKTILVITFLLASLVPVLPQGTILWDESINGPLAQTFDMATPLAAFQLGTNTIIGATEVERTGNNWFGHDDYFVIGVPASLVVTAVRLSVNKPNVWAWIGDQSYFSQLGFNPNPSNGDLLPQWGLGTLGPGPYGIYMANHDLQLFTSIANYRLDFVVQAIPEPGVVWFFAVGLSAVGLRRSVARRR